MEFLGVILLCAQLFFIVQARSDCPTECTCSHALYGGLVANCEQLNVNQNFSNSIHHLNVSNIVPNKKPFYLNYEFFKAVNLKDLQSIRIINSQLALIDQHAFSGMDNLNYVDLSNNLLIRIHPDTFENNTNLQQLSLSGNVLRLPESTTKPNYLLKSSILTDLDLSKCELRQITKETFTELPQLVSLNLESNYLHFLSPEMFDKLESLEEINLANNLITDVNPELFIDIEDLTKVNLSNNSISKFDDVDIESLRELDLSYNMFKTLESTALEGTPDVTNVNFSHNSIEKIDEDTFTDLNKLRYLDLSYNNIKGPLLKTLFETNEALETLLLAHNANLTYFDGFSGEFNNLYRLDLSYCGIYKLNEDAFESLQFLATLDLSGNTLNDLSSRTFSKLSRLNNLDLSNNQLKSLPADLFQENMDLRKLIIKGNSIHRLPAQLFQPVVHLTILDASNCHLSYLWNTNESGHVESHNILNQLSYLNLEGNKFKTLHKHHFNSMKNLKTLDISKNPFECDQQFALLIEWLIQQKITPARYVGKSSSDLAEEHAELHWGDLLSKICSGSRSTVSKETKHHTTTILSTTSDETLRENIIEKESLNEPMPIKPEDTEKDIYVKTIPEIDYASNFGLVPEHIVTGNSQSESDYPWIGPMFLIFICGLSILLALFNLAALLLYRSGRNYKVAGYRSTFITPFTGGIKVKRGSGSFYHKLYEECSVPDTVPIVKSCDDLAKSPKKNTIIISGATKGEDMV